MFDAFPTRDEQFLRDLASAPQTLDAAADLLASRVIESPGDSVGYYALTTGPADAPMVLMAWRHGALGTEPTAPIIGLSTVALEAPSLERVRAVREPILLATEPGFLCPQVINAMLRTIVEGFGTSGIALVPHMHGDDFLGVIGLTTDPDLPPPDQERVARIQRTAQLAAPFFAHARRAGADQHRHEVLDAVLDAVVVTDMDYRVTLWNRGAERLYGISEAEALWQPLQDLYTTVFDSESGTMEDAIAAMAKVGVWESTINQICRDGTPIRVLSRVSPIVNSAGQQIGLVGVNRDIGEYQVLQRSLRRTTDLANYVLDAMEGHVAVLDENGTIVTVNRAWIEFSGTEMTLEQARQNWAGVDYLKAVRSAETPDSDEMYSLEDQLKRVLVGEIPRFDMSYEMEVGIDSQTFDMSAVHLGGGGAVISHVDVTVRVRHEQDLFHQATHDALTGLPHRRAVIDALVAASDSARRGSDRESVAVIFCDLDRFKEINDTYGHAIGDQVLVAMAHRLRRAARDDDLVARYGGDEFVLVSRDHTSKRSVETLGERLRQTSNEPIRTSRGMVSVGVSVGIALVSTVASTREAEAALTRADAAMYAAKSQGGNRVVVVRTNEAVDLANAGHHNHDG